MASLGIDDNLTRRDLLLPGEARENVYLSHPLVTDRAKIPTPSIKQVFDVIKNALIQREPGVCFTAEPRFGKTYAIDVLEAFVPQSFPGIPIAKSIAKYHQRPSEKSFYEDILTDLGGDISSYATAASRRIQVTNRLIAASHQMNSDRIIFFVDEAQNWHENELTWLRDISNALESQDIRLITIMFAHPDINNLRTLLIGRRTDLIGRFLVRPKEFRGVVGPQDIKEVFSCLDDAKYSSYPSNSGISYSEFFRPVEYGNGWRLSEESGACWAAFNGVMRKHGGTYDIGMKWLIGALKIWLGRYWSYEHGYFQQSAAEPWEEVVRDSDFAASLAALKSRNRPVPK